MSKSVEDETKKAISEYPDTGGGGTSQQQPTSEEWEVSHAAEVVEETDRNLTFLNTLSGQAVVIVLPTIGRDLGTPDSRLQSIVSAYPLTFGRFLLLWGRIAVVYGKRKILVWGSAWLAATVLVNTFLPNEIAFDLLPHLRV
ncbi:hypothetical protein VTK56DRAFT_9785 [Thermocarpiscus australiensis]